MFHVYVILSETHPDRYYIGFSSRPGDRLIEHTTDSIPVIHDMFDRRQHLLKKSVFGSFGPKVDSAKPTSDCFPFFGVTGR